MYDVPSSIDISKHDSDTLPYEYISKGQRTQDSLQNKAENNNEKEAVNGVDSIGSEQYYFASAKEYYH